MSWSEITNGSGSGASSGEKVNYLKTPVGITKIRIVDAEPKSRWTHWIQAANGGTGMSVGCPGKGCPVCAIISADRKIKATPRYSSAKSHALNVIDRKDGSIALMDKGNSIFGQIVDIMGQMPDVMSYDLTITRRGEKKEATYTVIPCFPPTPITEAERALVKYDVDLLTKPFTIAQTQMFMDGAMMEAVVATMAPPEVQPVAQVETVTGAAKRAKTTPAPIQVEPDRNAIDFNNPTPF